MEAYVKTEVTGSIARIEFFHPAHNSLPSTNLRELKLAIEEAGKDDSINLILLQSGGSRTSVGPLVQDWLVAWTN